MYAICIDSSHRRGMGHLFRALNLAGQLRARRIGFTIFLNDHPPSISILRREKVAYRVVSLDCGDTDWESPLIATYGIRVWINDRLDTDVGHATRVKKKGVTLVTFDDRGTGATLADLHVAALAFENAGSLGGKRVLTGVRYLILNPEIDRFKRLRTQLGSLLVTLGGTDTFGVTVNVMRILAAMGMSATVILGPGFEHHLEVKGAPSIQFSVKTFVPSLMEEFSKHDLAITGGGLTPFEAIAGGLPCLTISSEPFEIEACRFLERTGASRYVGQRSELNERSLASAILDAEIGKMSAAGPAAVGTRGAECVLTEIAGL